MLFAAVRKGAAPAASRSWGCVTCRLKRTVCFPRKNNCSRIFFEERIFRKRATNRLIRTSDKFSLRLRETDARAQSTVATQCRVSAPAKPPPACTAASTAAACVRLAIPAQGVLFFLSKARLGHRVVRFRGRPPLLRGGRGRVLPGAAVLASAGGSAPRHAPPDLQASV